MSENVVKLLKTSLLVLRQNDVMVENDYMSDIVRNAIIEIERLRKLAGVVSTKGEDLADIKRRVHPGRRRE